MDDEKTTMAEREFIQSLEDEAIMPNRKEQREMAAAFFITGILSALIFYAIGAFGQTSININTDISMLRYMMIPILIYGAFLFIQAKDKREWNEGMCLVFASLIFIISLYAMAAGIISRQ